MWKILRGYHIAVMYVVVETSHEGKVRDSVSEQHYKM
jgi:hypothetical protein